MTSDKSALHEGRTYRIRGRVQGVGFRWWTRSTAEGLGLSGGVRNLPDGSVTAWAVGPPEALDRFESALRRGPGSARVEHLEVAPLEGRNDAGSGDRVGRHSRFHIEH